MRLHGDQTRVDAAAKPNPRPAGLVLLVRPVERCSGWAPGNNNQATVAKIGSTRRRRSLMRLPEKMARHTPPAACDDWFSIIFAGGNPNKGERTTGCHNYRGFIKTIGINWHWPAISLRPGHQGSGLPSNGVFAARMHNVVGRLDEAQALVLWRFWPGF